ncbi:MAG: c-type cytochrome [Candidatus Eisenbacteria bacterium]|uniref:C-type cytochrome n=1 Tax=Eiseniibacteriota bacterium TaxID=2212470 RepID=A0A933SCJ7_UNCEI|nr:c-type cytochrome [Candidatus Eisenbacteria bacterium]
MFVTFFAAVGALQSPPRAYGDTADGVQPPADSVGSASTDSSDTSGSAESEAPPAPAPPRVPPPAKAFGHLETGKGIFESTCLPCHGANAEGNKDIGAPALNRQEPWYLLAQLRKFRGGIRGAKDDDIGGQMMAPMAMALADEQAMLDVAVYVASLEGEVPARTLRGDRAAGERTFKMICAACHGANGAGRPEIRTPALAGQADWYLVGQLTKFRRGLRGYHDLDISGMQMRGMAAALSTDKAVVDVASYIASMAQ